MPSLTIQEIVNFSPIKTYIFVETGTFMGQTVAAVIPYFEKVISIELEPNFALNAQRNFKKYNNVAILQGDSAALMPDICQKLDKPTFFWLDGHWSGGPTAKGNKDCPLLDELKHIVEHCKPECIIAIDDVRLFGTNKTEDWSEVTKHAVLDLVKSRLSSLRYFPSQLHPEDRMVIVLSPQLII